MNIIEKNYTLNGSLTKRTKTDTIVLHHRVGDGDVEGIDRIHKGNGWACIGYHFYVRKDGSIYRGRQENTVGAHAYGSNSTSIGICAEGNFETDIMPEVQKQAIIELIAYLKGKYNISRIVRHKDVNATACPGKNFPFDEIVNGKTTVSTTPAQVTGKVATIQQTLNSRYGLNIAVDNIAGSQTKKAIVTALQKELNKQYNKGLVIDGIFGSQTKKACISLKKGAQGNITWLMQARLACLGYNITVDGIFGNETLSVVKQFQKSKGTTADGWVYTATWGKLFE